MGLICLLGIVLVLIGIYEIPILIDKKYRRFVLDHSCSIKGLQELNTKYIFHNISNYHMMHSYDNEHFYNDIQPKDYLIYQLVFIQKDVIREIKLTKDNWTLYRAYQNEVKNVCVFGNYDTEDLLRNKNKLIEKEKEIFQSLLQCPTIEFLIKVVIQRTNLNGRYYEEKYNIFSAIDIKEFIEEINDKTGGYYRNEEIWQSICRVERGKVTNKVRFAIYKRDGYRCRKCGRATNDLEIDHIFPISKGGKSEFSNLQTLCHSCNVLKSDNIEYRTNSLHNRNTRCPICGAKLMLREGKYGVFYGCSNYPSCSYTRNR